VGSDFDQENSCQTCANGGLTMRADCREVFICYSLLINGGKHLTCDEGYIIDIDLFDLRMTCIPDNGQCPGLGGYTLGCPEAVPTQTPVTNDEVNPLGTCKCEGQFFSSSDCTQAFWCGADVANNIGGLQECQEGQIVRPNFEEDLAQCVTSVNQCPGAFNVNCPDEDVGNDFDQNNCACNDQVWVNNDCSTGFYCDSAMANGGKGLKCGTGEMINIDISAFTWTCVQDQGHCPGLGGFSLGTCSDNNGACTDLVAVAKLTVLAAVIVAGCN
jgi:hypothetical protein